MSRTGGAPDAVFSSRRIAELTSPPGGQMRVPTEEQAHIIEQPLEGTALVIAGAGSGKTETMANRVVWLVANGLVAPAGVLGLTFTRKAAGELNERIADRLIGFASRLEELGEQGRLEPAEAARSEELRGVLADGLDLPDVGTYNAFASGIVQEFGAMAGIASTSTVIDEATAWRIAREVVCQSEDLSLANLDSSIGALVKHTIALDHAVSDHLTTFEAVEAEIAEFSRSEGWSCEDHPQKKPYADVVKAIAAVGATRLVARLARAFSLEKRRRGLIEFSDQLRLAMETLSNSPTAVRSLRERSPVVLLDEVQDTSVGQSRLLAGLFAGRSVMAVGDPHQSIYGFRGASASNLISFHRDFAGSQSTDATGPIESPVATNLYLSVSWRNPEEILEAANLISRPLAEKLEDQSGSGLRVPKLVSRDQYLTRAMDSQAEAPERSRKDPSRHTPVRLESRYTETVDEEYAGLAEWMARARQEHLERTGSGASAAVLFRSRRRMPAVQAALLEAGVPCRIEGLGGLLATPEVTDVVSALRCLWYADAGSDLIRILAGPRFRVGVKDISGLRKAARWFAQRDGALQPLEDAQADLRASSGSDATSGLPDPDREVTLIDAVDEIAGMRSLDRPSLAGISEEGRQRLREAGQALRRLRQGIGGNLLELLRAVERELLLDIELDANERNAAAGGAAARANLDAFADLVERFLGSDEHGTLASVLEWLERAIEADEVAEHVSEPEPGTVQLITVHGAKGLEWDLVAVPRLVEGEFPGSSREGMGWLRPGELPDRLRGDISARPQLDWPWLVAQANQKSLSAALGRYRAELQERHADEERRLAYVALTRAASRLFLCGSWWGGTKTPRGPSAFLRELEEAGIIDRLPEASAHEADPRPETGRTLTWPLDPLGQRSGPVLRAADALRTAVSAREPGGRRVAPSVELLIAERAADASEHPHLSPPERITASTFHEFVESPEKAERARLRPIPRRPYRRTRVGNLFHEWVERRTTTPSGTALTLPGLGNGHLIDTMEDGERDLDWEWETASDSEDLELQSLIERFERSRFAQLLPIAVELEVNLPFAGRSLACKLDAVYEHSDTGRIEIVDWKSGSPPRNDAERASRFLQLELYRHAYSRWANADPDRIDVTLFYVAEEQELRGAARYSYAELEEMWISANENPTSIEDPTDGAELG